ncbi:MAG: transglutaminaseTgpA domain-containing protein [Planctomycetota bacterium]|nr:transglutaminaseTgpA domain-containing protein [Planctomycetota bacterium]
MRLLTAGDIATYLLVFLGILAYSVADADLTYAVVALPVLIASWLLVAGPRGRPFPRYVLNGLLLVATINLIRNWGADDDTVSRLCRYLCWLQLIKMFEPRTPRDRSQTLVMSVMLVIGACLTSVSIELGAVLLVYCPALLASTMLHQVFASQGVLDGADAAPGPPAASRRVGASSLARRLLVFIFGEGGESHPRARHVAPSGRNPIRNLVRAASIAGALILAGGVAVYVVMPRGFGEGFFGTLRPLPAAGAVTGFRDHVQLGAEGLLSESRRPVMLARIESFNAGGAPGAEFYLRGAVLDYYNPENRLWERSREARSSMRETRWVAGEQPADPPPGTPYYRMEVTVLEPTVDTIFTIWRPRSLTFTTAGPRRIQYKRSFLDGVHLLSGGRGGPLTYEVVAAPFDLVPESVAAGNRLPVRSDPTRIPQFHDGPIARLAARLLSEAGIDPADPARETRERVAKLFTRHLQSNYAYTTQMIAPLPGQDPIEMFLFDRERGGQGHCEYFASALAALCLSVDIPARVVTGYVASEYDPATAQYTVRESHAHAWAEVEIRPRRWETFDPSPDSVVARLHAGADTGVDWIRRAMDAMQLAWVRSIVTFDQRRQAGAIRGLGRLIDEFRAGPGASLSALNEWVAGLLRTESELADQNKGLLAVRLAAWTLLLGTVLSLAVYTAITRLPRALAAIFGPRRSAAGTDEADASIEPIARRYRALLEKLRRAGMERPPATPALAFARSLGPGRRAISEAAERIVGLYYESRYARRPLTAERLADADEALRRVDEALDPRRAGTTPR